MTRHGTTSSFNLPRGDMTTLRCLQAVFAKGNRVTGLRKPAVLALELLAKFGALRLQHRNDSLLGRLLGGLGAVLADFARIQHFALENPDLHADHAVGGTRLGEAV